MSTPWGINFEITEEMLKEVSSEEDIEAPVCICSGAPPAIHTVFHAVKNAIIQHYDSEYGGEASYAEIACGTSNALVEFVLHLCANRSEAEETERKFMPAISETFKRVIDKMEKRGDFVDEGEEKRVDENTAESATSD